MRRVLPLLAALLLAAGAARAAFSPNPALRFDVTPEELTRDCARAQQRAKMRLEAVADVEEGATFDNTAAALDRAAWGLVDETASDAFLREVAVSSAVRQAALDCDASVSRFMIDVYAREDLFRPLKAFADGKPRLAPDEQRLLDKELEEFKRNGLLLPVNERDELKIIDQRIAVLEDEFDKNVTESAEGLWLTDQELSGLSDDYIARLDHKDGKYRVTVDEPDYVPFMENAKDADARRRLELLFDNRAAAANLPILEETLTLRARAARLLGYPNHAALVLEDRMAKDPETVERFIDRLVARLRPMAEAELKELSALKRRDVGPHGDARIDAWDWRYYDNELRKERYAVDEEKLKAYFPLQTVIGGMLDVYQRVLGVRFKRVENAAVWAPDVALYEVLDASPKPGHEDEALGYFYMDLFPRAGKYKHAASFQLINGRLLADGSYQKPVSAIVANFSKPSPGKPSLLLFGEHEEVETIFHEFGHVMHQTLTTARFGRFSGSHVDQDFLEAPSQMFENWTWDPRIIGMMSGRYDDPARKLPPDVLKRMIAARNLDSGIKNLRQLMLAGVDMAYHAGSAAGDPTKVWERLARQIALVPMAPDTVPEAGFGHIMDGYDAGYYGYMWSKVYAQDMFTRFQDEGLLNPAIGRSFRDVVLAPGGSREPLRLIEDFLGRKPNEDAFLASIGLAR